jgi:hypothetical protein
MSKELKRRSPLKAIRRYCIECSGDNMAEAKRCELKDCPLHPYRMGKTGRTRAANPKALAALAAGRERQKAR